MAATLSPQEVFNHQAQALGAEDLEEIVADYSDDAIFITSSGVQHGKDGIRTLGQPNPLDGEPFPTSCCALGRRSWSGRYRLIPSSA